MSGRRLKPLVDTYGEAACLLEQQIIGLHLRGDPGTADCLPEVVAAAAIFQPPHDRILSAMADAARVGALSAPAVALRLAGDRALDTEFAGGIKQYLVTLANAAPATENAAYARRFLKAALRDLRANHARRDLADRAAILADDAARGDVDILASTSDFLDLARRAQNDDTPAIEASPFIWTEPQDLPRREWLYGKHLIRRFVSATISPGGVGKSSLTLVEALAMASGKPLLGESLDHPLRVWIWNLEDPEDETRRRIGAAALQYGLKAADLADRLFVNGRSQACIIAHADRSGTYIVRPLVDQIVAELVAKKIDVLMIDPFVSCHAVSENDNGAIDLVVKEWARVADRADCAVEHVHHSRKVGEGEVTAESSRGASSAGNAWRSVRVLNRMTKDEGERAGVENHRSYFKAARDKANLAPPPEHADWFKIENISIGNGPPADHVGVVVRWQWPDAFDGIAPGTLFAVQKLIAASEWKQSPQAQNWAGNAVAEAMGMDISDASKKSRCRTLLNTWLKGGALKVVRKLDDSRHERPFIEVGQWVSL